MKIDEPVFKQAFRRGWRIQLNVSKDRTKFVELVAFLFHESREAKHVDEQNKRGLEWLHHQIFAMRSFSSRAGGSLLAVCPLPPAKFEFSGSRRPSTGTNG